MENETLQTIYMILKIVKPLNHQIFFLHIRFMPAIHLNGRYVSFPINFNLYFAETAPIAPSVKNTIIKPIYQDLMIHTSINLVRLDRSVNLINSSLRFIIIIP